MKDNERQTIDADSHHAPSGQPDAGAYIGHEPEFAAETIPGGIGPGDERVAADNSQSSGEGALDERAQGRADAWPAGHRRKGDVSDDDIRRAGDNPR
jgi:hypothetical protein